MPATAIAVGMLCALSLIACAQPGNRAPAPQPRQSRVVDAFYGQPNARTTAHVLAIVQKALESAPSGAETRWSAAGQSGDIIVRRTYKTKAGVYCRTYEERAAPPSRARTETACRTGPGVWARIVRK